MSQRRAGSSVGFVEVSSVWALFAIFAGAIFWTYARLPGRDFFHVSTSGPSGGAGRALVFLNFPVAPVATRAGSYDLYVVRADGSGLRGVTREPGAEFVPAWSPDGRFVVFVSYRDGRDQLFVIRSDGSGPARLTDVQADKDLPDWR